MISSISVKDRLGSLISVEQNSNGRGLFNDILRNKCLHEFQAPVFEKKIWKDYNLLTKSIQGCWVAQLKPVYIRFRLFLDESTATRALTKEEMLLLMK